MSYHIIFNYLIQINSSGCVVISKTSLSVVISLVDDMNILTFMLDLRIFCYLCLLEQNQNSIR